MRVRFFTLVPSLILAQAEPRVFDITPFHSIPETTPSFIHLTNGSYPDLFFPADPNGYNPYQKTNFVCLSHPESDSFQPPRMAGHPIESQTIWDGPPYFHQTFDPDSGLSISQLFLNEIYFGTNGNSYVPTIHDVFPLGVRNPRTPLAPAQAYPWIPIDLDEDDQVPEFLQAIPLESGGTELFIWERQANGSYSAQSTIHPLGITFDQARLIDLNNDELPDLHLFTAGSTGSHRFLKRESPRGFSVQPTYLGNVPDELTFADFNGDSLPDIIYVQDNRILWLLNQGDFTLSAIQSHSLPSLGFITQAAIHIPHAHHAETILVAQTSDDQLRFLELEFGTWKIVRQQQIDISAIQPHSKLEVIGFYPSPTFETPAILLRVTSFFPHNQYNHVNRLAVAKFMVHAPSEPAPSNFYGPAEFIHPSPLDTAITLVADFDGDGTQDIVLGPDLDGHVALITNDGTGKFSPPTLLTELAPPAGSPQVDPTLENPFQPGASEGTQIAQVLTTDINGDQIPDLVIRYQNLVYLEGYQTAYSIALGIGNGRFHHPTLPTGAFETITQGPTEMDHLVDWDGDGKIDLIAKGRWHQNLGTHFSPMGISLVASVTFEDMYGFSYEVLKTSIGDIDVDGHPDIVSLVTRIEETVPIFFAGFPLTSFSSVSFNDGLGDISRTVEFRTDLASIDSFGNPVVGDLVVADINLDGLPDIHHTAITGTDDLGNPIGSTAWKQNPGNGCHNPESWQAFPIDNNPVKPSSPFLDFDGDRQPEWVSLTGYLKPTPGGPIVSASHNFIGNLVLFPHSDFRAADFDGDGDADFLHIYGIQLTLIKNTLVDETNVITREFIAAGILPSLASPHADADGDGRDNLTEIIHGTNPFVIDSQSPNPFQLNLTHRVRPHGDPENEESIVSFNIPTNAEEYRIVHELEKSTDLRHWQTIPQSLLVEPPGPHDPPNPWKSIHHEYDPSQPGTYFRVKSYQN